MKGKSIPPYVAVSLIHRGPRFIQMRIVGKIEALNINPEFSSLPHGTLMVDGVDEVISFVFNPALADDIKSLLKEGALIRATLEMSRGFMDIDCEPRFSLLDAEKFDY